MTESPSAKPTASFSWTAVTNGTSEPSSGLRIAGWEAGEAPSEQNFNWWWQKTGESLEWCRANAVRHFDNMYDAINGTSVEDVFVVTPPERGRVQTAHQNNTAASTITKIATDGRIVVTVDGQVVRGEPNAYVAATFASTALWSYDAATEQGIDATKLSTDGIVVAIANGITGPPPRVVIVTTAGDDGGMVYEDADTGYVFAICADSYGSNTPRVWWGTYGGAGADKIFRWTGGARTQMLTGLTDVQCMCATADHLIFSTVAATNVSLHAYYKEAFTLAWNVASFVASLGARSQAVCSDGDLVFHILDGVTGSAAPSLRAVSLLDGSGGTPIWSVTAGSNRQFGSNIRVECDRRHVYAMWSFGGNDCVAVFDKATGRVVWYYATPSITDFCIDGRNLMVAAGDGRVYYYPTAAQPDMWIRRDGYDATREPAKLLALPVGAR